MFLFLFEINKRITIGLQCFGHLNILKLLLDVIENVKKCNINNSGSQIGVLSTLSPEVSRGDSLGLEHSQSI